MQQDKTDVMCFGCKQIFAVDFNRAPAVRAPASMNRWHCKLCQEKVDAKAFRKRMRRAKYAVQQVLFDE